MAKDSGLWMIVLPVEPVILQVVHPCETSPFGFPRESATIESPAVRLIVHKRPWSVVAEELERLVIEFTGKHTNGSSIRPKYDHDGLAADNIK